METKKKRVDSETLMIKDTKFTTNTKEKNQ
jgi:hypothetical protein